ncbi:hypothetical protein G6F31_020121 [Rhizopus arrhizus]|nr:hypothetical protein G6F31_020121 [Rhizopus arrhizus]
MERRAEDDEAQVHDAAGGENQPQRRARGDQRQRRQLGGPRVEQQGHGQRHGLGQAGLDHGHPGHPAPGRRGDQGRHDGVDTGAECGQAFLADFGKRGFRGQRLTPGDSDRTTWEL